MFKEIITSLLDKPKRIAAISSVVAVCVSVASLSIWEEFYKLSFINMQVIQSGPKQLFLLVITLVFCSMNVLVLPVFFYILMRKDKHTSSFSISKEKKKHIKLMNLKSIIRLRSLLNNACYPFFVSINPFVVRAIMNEDIFLCLALWGIGVLIWMSLDYVFFRKFYNRFFEIIKYRNKTPKKCGALDDKYRSFFLKSIKSFVFREKLRRVLNIKICYVLRKNIVASSSIYYLLVSICFVSVFSYFMNFSSVGHYSLISDDEMWELLLFQFILITPLAVFLLIKGKKGFIISICLSLVVTLLVISMNQVIFEPWFEKNHYANYSDYVFIFNREACEELKFNNISLINDDKGNCKIKNKYRVLSTNEKVHRIEIIDDNFNKTIEDIEVSKVRHVQEIYRYHFEINKLKKLLKKFNVLFDKGIMVAIREHENHFVSESYQLDNVEINLSSKDKELYLGYLILAYNSMISLIDDASIVNSSYKGSIIDNLTSDKNDVFYHELINKFVKSHMVSTGRGYSTKYLTLIFQKIMSDRELFSTLGRMFSWKSESFMGDTFIEYAINNKGIQTLLLYSKQKDLVIAIHLSNENKELSLTDLRVRNLIKQIIIL